ncbi:hypothetical protein appser11_10220 [Actinobacillus pleuropneumoniae serovar 11 str. 56153]|nr:hypothetical protein appser2_10260 [Actinobacillus pleuropneumoniae serovar 2 str. S1536]EFM94276.1 hypothetical protein appser9_10220 [Actinobacillus pleuropneumoniae serovar 9 str. CVJ13261]EFM98749.1 hypothetical protein appser11_10220 [Actinobacillus pleuropneumoniae serovar 11 str. 56153]
MFYEKSLKRERKSRADRAMDTAYGVNGGNHLQDYIKELTSP